MSQNSLETMPYRAPFTVALLDGITGQGGVKGRLLGTFQEGQVLLSNASLCETEVGGGCLFGISTIDGPGENTRCAIDELQKVSTNADDEHESLVVS